MDGLDARLARSLGSGDADDLGYDLAEAGRPGDARRCFEAAAAQGSAVASFGLGNVLQPCGAGRGRAARPDGHTVPPAGRVSVGGQPH